MIGVPGSILLCLLAVWCFGNVVVADVIVLDGTTTILALTRSYAVSIASILDFAPVTGPTYFAGDQCKFSVQESDFPNNAIIFFTRASGCDEGSPLLEFSKMSDKIGAVVELFGSPDALSRKGATPDADPYDLPPRFSYDPRPSKRSLIYTRVHGSDGGLAAQYFLKNNNTAALSTTVTYTSDPWKTLYLTPQWLTYEVVVVAVFCIYIPQHSLRSLIYIARTRRKLPFPSSNGVNLQLVMMSASFVLGLDRILEYSTEILRDYFDIWTPEIVSQLAWGYAYYILLMSMLLLVLFWADVLRTSKVKLLMIDRVTTQFYVLFGFIAWVVLTVLISLFVYEVPGTTYVRSAGFLLLGSVALFESIGSMVYGGRLLRQLTNVKPIAERGGSFHRTPSVVNEELVVSDNPSYDPSMSNSESAKAYSPRLSLANRVSSPRSNRQLSSDDSEDKRQVRLAQKRAKPLTRLVIVSAALLFAATALSAAASFTTLLNSPRTYISIFAPLAAIEITIYSLVIHTMSPIWQERRRRFGKARSESTLKALSEERGMSIDEAPKPQRCLRPLCISVYKWFAI